MPITFSLKQRQTRASSEPITLPLTPHFYDYTHLAVACPGRFGGWSPHKFGKIRPFCDHFSHQQRPLHTLSPRRKRSWTRAPVLGILNWTLQMVLNLVSTLFYESALFLVNNDVSFTLQIVGDIWNFKHGSLLFWHPVFHVTTGQRFRIILNISPCYTSCR